MNATQLLLDILRGHLDKPFFLDLNLTFSDFLREVQSRLELQITSAKKQEEIITLSAPLDFNPQRIYDWAINFVCALLQEKLICLKSEADPYIFANIDFKQLGPGLILKTSGSTSRPKLVYHPFENISKSCERFYQFYQEKILTTWQLNLPLNHVGGLSILLRSIYFGLPLVVNENRKHIHPRAKAISLVPTQLAHFLKASPNSLEALDFILIGGAPAPTGLRKLASNLQVSYSYGLTESFAAIGAAQSNDNFAKFFPGIEAKLEGNRLFIKGPGLLHKLITTDEREELTYHNFNDQYYPTQDEAILSSEGQFQILGRADQVIISGGEKIDINEVENLINSHVQIEASKVLGAPDSKWGEALAIFISPYTDELAQEISDHLTKKLGPHYRPKIILNLAKVTYKGIKPTKENFLSTIAQYIEMERS